ncbi:uncharacterized protein LOC111261198 isoform X2 [Varroa jacobsoni]|uniref:uncharacterized protein LOC111261198 isoform X2 n=1 Tax=Varroa jacobsoni TaxID=62625 RepID=UPI000BF9C1C2|nr:uncharacterized protein LOC111261198 isoform X2 [Varroa jacobsoni]
MSDLVSWLRRRQSLGKVELLDALWHISSLLLIVYHIVYINTPFLPMDRQKQLFSRNNWLLPVDAIAVVWPISQLLNSSASNVSSKVLSSILLSDFFYHRLFNIFNFIRALYLLNVAIYEFQWGQWSASYSLAFESLTLFVCSVLHKTITMVRQLQMRLRHEGFSRVEDIPETPLVVIPRSSKKSKFSKESNRNQQVGLDANYHHYKNRKYYK